MFDVGLSVFSETILHVVIIMIDLGSEYTDSRTIDLKDVNQ